MRKEEKRRVQQEEAQSAKFYEVKGTTQLSSLHTKMASDGGEKPSKQSK